MNEASGSAWPLRTLRVNGIDLAFCDVGSGVPVLLVHGFPDSHAVWRHQIPALVEAGYRVIAPDMRGYGASEAPLGESAYTVDKLVGDLVALLDGLGIDKVRLVAHDWGAVIGWQLCIRHPQRVDRYVALSVGHPNAYARGGFMQKLKGYYILLFQLRGVAEWLIRAGDWFMFRVMTRDAPEVQRWMAELGRPGRLTAAINYYRANFAMLFRGGYPAVRVPVMGVWSDGDVALVETQMSESARYVEGPWRYARIDGASHWLQLEVPGRVNDLLLDYLK
jgi:pimeloyl-ACP methyl ester carboxylesterase